MRDKIIEIGNRHFPNNPLKVINFAHEIEDVIHIVEHCGMDCDCPDCMKYKAQIAKRLIEEAFGAYYENHDVEFEEMAHIPTLLYFIQDWLDRRE